MDEDFKELLADWEHAARVVLGATATASVLGCLVALLLAGAAA